MNLYTTKTAASLLGLAADSICTYAKRYGVGTKIGRDWVFNSEDLIVIASRKGRVGRPPKEKV